MALFTKIDGCYNPERRHSGIQYVSSAEFERKHPQTQDRQKIEVIWAGLFHCPAGWVLQGAFVISKTTFAP